MSKTNPDNPIGMVIEKLPDLRCRVEFEDGSECIAYVSGKMKVNRITVFVGDKVEVVIDKFGGKATNRIVRRV